INPSFNQSFSIFNRYRDTTIRIKLPSTAIGNRYQMFVRSQRLSDTVTNYSYYNISTAFPGWVDTIRILSSTQAKTDSMCINLATPLTLQVRAFGGRIQDSNISPGAALYSYRWYGNSVNSNQNGWQLTNTATAINNSTLNVPNDTPGTRYYYVVISDSISGSSVCNNYRVRKTGVLGTFTVFGLPKTDTAANFKTGDTVCFLGSTAFKTLTINPSALSAPILYSYRWYKSSDSISYSILNYATASSLTLSKDSANLMGNNYIYGILYNGPQRLNCSVKTQTTTNYYLIDSPIRPTPPISISLNFNINDTVKYLIPTPSSTILWYNISTGGSSLASIAKITQGIYYVVNQQVSYNRTCQSTPRVAVQVYIYLPPQRPDSAIVSFSYNSQNQTLAKIFMPRFERSISSYDSPNRYYLLATTLNSSGPNRTIIIDSFLRGTSKLTKFFTYDSGYTFNLSTIGLLNKERFRFFVQATNSAGTLTSNASRTQNGDSIWVITPLVMNSYRSTNWNSRSSTNSVTPGTDPSTINYIKLPTLNLNSTNYTIELWAKLNSSNPTSWTRFFDFSPGTNLATGVVFGLPTSKFGMHSNGSDALSASIFTSFLGGIQVSDWHHYALTLSGSSTIANTSTLSLYIDGVFAYNVTNQNWLATSLTTNYIGRPTYADPTSSIQIQDVRIWKTALTEQLINELYTKNLAAKSISTDTLIKYRLFYWLPLGNLNNERRTTTIINQVAASTSTGVSYNPIDFSSQISGYLNNEATLYYGNTPQTATNSPLLMYDSNSSYSPISTSLQAGKRFYVAHRTLNINENVLYRLINPDGTVNTNWTPMQFMEQLNTGVVPRPNDKYANLPTNFYAGIIQTCISTPSTNICNTEPQTSDTIRTVADAPILDSLIGRSRGINIRFTRRDSGYSPIT
ncbi:MAG: LamG domain-containing protein, partial [Sediminibacterium sp.]|nr:LamG domain-containing protein [Sediminibacterium sp.]